MLYISNTNVLVRLNSVDFGFYSIYFSHWNMA
jgi:hypothetical protein